MKFFKYATAMHEKNPHDRNRVRFPSSNRPCDITAKACGKTNGNSFDFAHLSLSSSSATNNIQQLLQASSQTLTGRKVNFHGTQEGGVVKHGDEEGMKMATSLLEEFGLPVGLLPLAEVIEVGFVRDTGYMWILQKEKVEHNFKMIRKLVSYSTEITGYITTNKIQKLKGVNAKELMLWPPVNEIVVDDAGKIHFKSLADITKTFPVEAFSKQ